MVHSASSSAPRFRLARRLLGVGAALLPAFALAALTPPKPVTIVSPTFPPELRSAGAEGKAVVKISISETGAVTAATLKSADHPAFGAAAVEAAKQWTFTPAMRDGTAIAIAVDLPMHFNLPVEEKINIALGRKVFMDLAEPVLEARDLKERPKPLKAAPPVYPSSLVGSGTSADVPVEFIITTEGKVINPKPLGDARGEILIAAIATVARYEFAPVMHNGQVVNCRMVTSIRFRDPQAAGAPAGKDGKKAPKADS
jgi:TonB family protein